MTTTVQPDLQELLDMAGVKIRGRRGDCPECGSRRTVAINESKEVFCCHHAGCGFQGNVVTLRRRLGIKREWIPDEEYRQMRRQRANAQEAAARLYGRAHRLELELQERIRMLANLETAAHDCGPDRPEAWDLLASIYAERPQVEAKLDILESGDIAEIYQLVKSDG